MTIIKTTWVGAAPKPANAFTIPEKSSVTASDKKFFTNKIRKHSPNMTPIVLPNSSKYPPLKMMTKGKV